MRGNVCSTTFLATALFLGSVIASPVKIRNGKLVKALAQRDSCAQTTYTVITPSPGAAPTPVTAQFQSVYSCYPQYVVCNAQSTNNCNTVYSTTSYQWVSTKVPCYNGMCLMTAAYQPITFSAQPTYAISTCTCDAPGNCVYGDSTTYVPAPTSFPYVDTGMQYYVAPYNSYNDFHYGSSGGVGGLEVDVYTCAGGVCDIYPINMVYSVQVTTNYVTYPININQYCPENTAIVVNGGVNIDITIVVSNAPTTVSTVVSGTSTVTSTRTQTTTKTITNAKTATRTTTASATATVTAGTSPQFVLQANLGVNAKRVKRADDISFVAFSNGLGALKSSCTDATRFTLNSLGQVLSNFNTIYATTGDATAGQGSFKLGSGAISTTFSFPDDLLQWVNDAFSGDNNAASFCATSSGAITVIYGDAGANADCTPITLLRVDPNTNDACNGSPTTSSTESSSSGTGAVNINTSLRSRSSTRRSSTTTTTSSTKSSSSGTGDVNINTSLRSSSSSSTGPVRTTSSSSSSTGTGDANSSAATTDGTSSSTSSSDSGSATLDPINGSSSSSATTSSSRSTGSSIRSSTGSSANTGTSTTSDTSTGTSSSATSTSTGICADLVGLLQETCIQIGTDPCTLGGIAQVDTNNQAAVIRLCPNNINPAVQTCLNGVATNPLTTLGDCINAVAKLGSDPTLDSTCATLPAVQLQALCLTTGGSPCTDAGLSKVSVNQQAAVIQLCANNLGPGATTCVNGVTNGLTTLDQCLAGLTQITAAGNDPSTVCPATIASVQVRALCIAVGGSLCTAAGVANVAANQQQQVISACPNNINPALQTCLNGAGTFGTNLQDCVAGVAKITAAGQDPSTVCGGALTVNLQVLCLTVGGDPCTAAGIAKVSTTQQAAVIAACPNQISPAVAQCLAGTQTNALTTLDACLAGVATLNGNTPATCSTLTAANLLALCLANDGQNPCDAAALVSLSTSAQTTRLQVCGQNAPKSVQTCVANAGANVNTCLNSIITLGGGAAADSTCATELTGTLAANLGLACVEVGGDPCTKNQILNLGTLAAQGARITACNNAGLDLSTVGACARLLNLGTTLTTALLNTCLQ